MPLFFIAFLRGKFCDILVTVMFYSGYIMIEENDHSNREVYSVLSSLK